MKKKALDRVSENDINVLKCSIEELRAAYEDAITTIESMPFPLLTIESGLKVKHANQSFYGKFKLSRNDTEGRLISELGNGPWTNTALLQKLERTIKDKINFDKFEIEYNFSNIGKKIILVSASSARLPSTNANVALVALEDITEIRLGDVNEQKSIDATKKALIAQERELLAEAEKANRIKDEFLATLSHELRTPLTAILGWAQELKNSNLDQKTVSDGLAVIERSAQAQGQLINDLLDISRIQSAKLPLDMKIIDLAKILNVATDSIKQLADNKSVIVEKKIDLVSCTVFADSTRLQQVFWNLLTNSVKFTPAGGKISVILKSAKTQNGENAVIKITDTGLGIKAEFLNQLFQRFSQADSSTARTYGGLGLGLAIARSLVEMQNGKIAAESDGEGKGATFTITLPMIVERDISIKKYGESAEQLKVPVRLDGISILAVDDNEDNRVLFSIILKSLGAEVRLAESAAQALAILKDYNPNIILSDISMPAEDGFSLFKKIQQKEAHLKHKTPIIALTAHAGQEDIKRVLDAGFSAHIAKPVKKSLLSYVIKKLIST